jgi:hypothetical protein
MTPEIPALQCTGCESGRQDSNLRPLVPQISPHFPMSAEFDFEGFRRKMVGVTTRARVMESIGMRSTRSHAHLTLLTPPPLPTLGILAAVVHVEHLEPLDLVTARWGAPA